MFLRDSMYVAEFLACESTHSVRKLVYLHLFTALIKISLQSSEEIQINADKSTLKVLVTTIDTQWEGMGDVGSARYKPALLPHARP